MKLTALLFLICITLFSKFLSGQTPFRDHNLRFNYYMTNDPDLAEQELNLQSQYLSNRIDSIKYIHNRVTWLLKKNDPLTAETLLEKSLEHISPDDLELQAGYLSLKASLLLKKSRYQDAIRLLQAHKTDYPELDSYNRSNLSLKLANAFFRTGNMDSAAFFSDLSYAEAKHLTGIELAQICGGNFTLQGEINLFKSAYDSAYFFHLKALDIYKKSNHIFGTASALSSIAGIMMFQEDYRKALNYYKQALPYYEAVRIKPYDVFTNIGLTYEKLGETDSSFFYYRIAYKGALETNRLDIQANCAGGLGNVYAKTGDYDSSVYYYQHALTLFELFNYDYGRSLCLLGIATAHLETGNYDAAETEAEKALEISLNLGSKELLKQCYEISYKVKEKKGDYPEAFIHYRQFVSLKDSISGEEVKNHISELEITHESDLKKLENQRLRLKIDAQKQKQKFDRIFFILLSLCLVSLLLVMLFIYLNQKRRLKIRQVEMEKVKIQNDLLQVKLETSKDAILKKNKIIEELEKSVTETPVDHQEISKQLLEKINSANEWAEFMIEFNLLYKSFYPRLNEHALAPLSKNELRMSALIRLNLSNKEISELLNISVDAVKKAKNRLAKKLRLENESSITSLISSI